MRKAIVMGVMVLTLAACAGGDRGLRDLRSNSGGPDEFQVNPVNPLVLPSDLSNLPAPTPGGANRVDPNPNGEAVAALGGNPAALVPAGIPATDSAIVAAAGRNGVDPSIRQTLAAEDQAFRSRASRLSFFGGRDRYFAAYARQALDAYAELQRFRNAGVATPTAPPQ
ncbi:DUF3035 domain-containing protein [Pseudooctadecabacter jejudonensis]|uniref:Beta-barrel assembly machine subunit BamF n=1 Tax=Pseudooctadecabacter jejudonensis TaxID=1391910 RepID=A0A1Y5SAD7_9RHOB|nr:DUF3035 domain-containing protein [Pseudooctadecabacter jejudonensis]SLN36122.1 hypothetical protein PSJ8397_01839 [Pseudooctadecabacter jejudonensis]